jgi:glucoamylase
MSRSIVLSNGELCVALDNRALVRDIYYPHVGQEDHVRGRFLHRIGVWIDGQISWLSDDPSWEISILCEDDALLSAITARNQRLQVDMRFADIVYNERDIFFRRVTITNTHDHAREIRLYFAHQFEIYKSQGGDTGYFDPASHSVIHYKGRRVFLIGATLDGKQFSDYAVGLMNFNGQEGTYKDAEDGILSKNPIEHGPVDSVIGLYASYEAGQSRVCHYWIIAAQLVSEAAELNQYITIKTPEHLEQSALEYWKSWLKLASVHFEGLEDVHRVLFTQSLMYVRAHVDQDGGILASVDSDMLQYGLDTYSYVWPRDAAFAALALDRVGDKSVAKRFLEFCRNVISPDGYFMHKYLPDRSLGSSWHPWVVAGEFQLPIQEDETALPIIALHAYYLRNHDLELLEEIYAPLVERAANFMLEYRDTETKLPGASYDLWEEKRGISTFTASAVSAALLSAAELSQAVGERENEVKYRAAAEEIRTAIFKHLWDEKTGTFVKLINRTRDGIVYDRTIDSSSAYGIFLFGILSPEDPRLVRAWEATAHALSRGIPAGGLARYENDQYYRADRDSAGNPWIITTLWYAEYLIARAKKPSDLDRVREIFSWVALHAQPSGVLSEQLDPRTGLQISATPLTWSHAAYVTTMLKYLERVKEFKA